MPGGPRFGLGVVVAGGCAPGTLYRIGEGWAASVFTRGRDDRRHACGDVAGRGHLGGSFRPRLAQGCDLGAFFSALGLNGWVFGAGLAAGAYLGLLGIKRLA